MGDAQSDADAIRVPASARLRSAGYLLLALVTMLGTMAMAAATIIVFAAVVAGAVVDPVDSPARLAAVMLVSAVVPVVVLALASKRGRRLVIVPAALLAVAALTINMWSTAWVSLLLPVFTASAAGLFGLVTAAAVRRAEILNSPQRWEQEWLKRGQCPACGYLIAGLREQRCPECGRRWVASMPQNAERATALSNRPCETR